MERSEYETLAAQILNSTFDDPAGDPIREYAFGVKSDDGSVAKFTVMLLESGCVRISDIRQEWQCAT